MTVKETCIDGLERGEILPDRRNPLTAELDLGGIITIEDLIDAEIHGQQTRFRPLSRGDELLQNREMKDMVTHQEQKRTLQVWFRRQGRGTIAFWPTGVIDGVQTHPVATGQGGKDGKQALLAIPNDDIAVRHPCCLAGERRSL
jgi:hypothetical protein